MLGSEARGTFGLIVAWMLVSACSAEEAGPSSRANGAAGAAAGGTTNGSNILLMPTSGAVNAGGRGCQPGHYVGSFAGTYNSAAWGNGSVPLSIAAVASMGRPGLEFWLEQSSSGACPPGAEFCGDFTVKGGKIRGFANPFSDGSEQSGKDADNGFALAIRFEIDFGGELDCSRGQFRGLLQNGCYDVATILFRFEGTAPASYDPASSSFTNGQWTVKELPMQGVLFPPDANIGGMGGWQATLAQDNSTPIAQGGGFCSM